MAGRDVYQHDYDAAEAAYLDPSCEDRTAERLHVSMDALRCALECQAAGQVWNGEIS